MSSERDTTRIVRSWLEEGVTALPDRVLDGVLDQLPATRQRRSLWRGFAIGNLGANARLAMAAAAVVVVAVLGFGLLPAILGPEGPGGQSPSPAPSPTPTPGPSVEGALSPGRHAFEAFSIPGITYAVPPGWFTCFRGSEEAGVCSDREMEVALLIVENVVTGGCASGEELQSPPVGPSVDDLVAAISNLTGLVITPAVDVSISGFAGKELTVSAPTPPTCTTYTWATSGRTNGMGADETDIVRIVDVNGTRVLIVGAYHRATTEAAADAALVRQVLDSIQIAG